jgi:anthranilate/para-aminobenzoate synthase component I|tara:strand:- start:1147 stop:1263 length:117 start_codon:yes stop_codon:yes gene_type:complete
MSPSVRNLAFQKGDEAIFNVCGGILFDSEVSSEYDIVP